MDKEIFKKQLLYRSMHRGCKETDILLGNFISDKIAEFSDDKLQLYQNFIDEDDLMIYEWILNKSNAPEKYTAMVAEIRKFHGI